MSIVYTAYLGTLRKAATPRISCTNDSTRAWLKDYSRPMPTTPSADEYLPLLKTQMNEAFTWIEHGGYDPSRFEAGSAQWDDIPCTRFAYKDSPYFFEVSTARGAYSVRFSPGMTKILDHMVHLPEFDSVEGPFAAWLSFLRREVEGPDLWAMIHEGSSMFWPGGDVDDDQPFTDQELVQVLAGLDRARLFLVEAGVAEGLLREANAKLDYLVVAAKRSSRFEWFNLAFGVLWSIAVAVAFGPERARDLFETVTNAVRQLLPGR